MKKRIFAAALALVMCLGLLAACGNTSTTSTTTTNPFTGTWVSDYDSTQTYVFSDSGKITYYDDGVAQGELDYALNGNTATVTQNGESFSFVYSGDVLTVSFDGESATLHRDGSDTSKTASSSLLPSASSDASSGNSLDNSLDDSSEDLTDWVYCTWYYYDDSYYIDFYSDYTWQLVDSEDDLILISGTYIPSGTTASLYYDDGSYYDGAELLENATVLDIYDAEGYYYAR